ncbi:glucose dehydrogenase [Ceraceosorus guamensis]|uniref:Glucose dehydrogenase n=1 Tax=Ceraceosorus guamensis TaxID=1522189 RepID=A0A316VQT0_9BASI|nr:glucose dehydrogenase [Ceraceosorus guamensis]PWN39882.1 glucose dehydrogenase [Ceraceosorus guamensis]
MVLGFGAKSPLKTDPKTFASQASEAAPKSYDYVIIGGGTAGSVIASRLSEDESVTVCLLEAGGDNGGVLESKIPAAFGKLFRSAHDWAYETEEEEGLGNRKAFLPRGRFLGGSSSMNAMMYQHPAPSDLDEWAQKLGCKGWSYNDIKPYLRRAEKFNVNPQRPLIDTSHRGDEGTWQTGYSYLTPIIEHGFLPACEAAGIAASEDVNTPKGPLGVTRFQTFIDSKGQRSSAATAYLPPSVQQRKNLTIGLNAHVNRIIIDTSKGAAQAIGAEFQVEKDGVKWHVHANKEVVVCGGAYNTPQTLMLSGIGPEEELSKFGIPVIRQSPNVGRNMYDHLASGLWAKALPGKTLDYLGSDVKALPALVQWLTTGGGPMTTNVGEAAAFFRTSELDKNVTDYGSMGKGPDAEIIGAPLAFRHHGAVQTPKGTSSMSQAIIGLRPLSTGTVTLRSADVWDKAIIKHNYWSNPHDVKVQLAALRKAMEIFEQDSFDHYLDRSYEDDDPNGFWWPWSVRDKSKITDEQLIDFMKKESFTLYHPVGSARLGSDEASVVDLQLRVRGVNGLRVCDASIFPQQISGHPTATVIAIAEKASDLLRGKVAANEDATQSVAVASSGAAVQQIAALA